MFPNQSQTFTFHPAAPKEPLTWASQLAEGSFLFEAPATTPGMTGPLDKGDQTWPGSGSKPWYEMKTAGNRMFIPPE